MKKITLAAAVSAAAMTLALPAAAQSRLTGFYVGGDFGESKYTDACTNLPGCDDKDRQLGVFAGYRFHPNFAAELGYHDLGSASAPGATYDAKAFEADVVGMWPLGRQFSLYGKLGAYQGKAETAGLSEKNTDATFGFGAQWDFMPNLGVRAEWQRYPGLGGDTIVKTDVDVLRVGALWRF